MVSTPLFLEYAGLENLKLSDELSHPALHLASLEPFAATIFELAQLHSHIHLLEVWKGE